MWLLWINFYKFNKLLIKTENTAFYKTKNNNKLPSNYSHQLACPVSYVHWHPLSLSLAKYMTTSTSQCVNVLYTRNIEMTNEQFKIFISLSPPLKKVMNFKSYYFTSRFNIPYSYLLTCILTIINCAFERVPKRIMPIKFKWSR